MTQSDTHAEPVPETDARQEAAAAPTLRQRIETVLREAGESAYGNTPFYEALAEAVLPLLAMEREVGRIDGLGEGADIAEHLPTPDNCGEMSSFDGAWDSGTYAVAAALRARANEIDQQAGAADVAFLNAEFPDEPQDPITDGAQR